MDRFIWSENIVSCIWATAVQVVVRRHGEVLSGSTAGGHSSGQTLPLHEELGNIVGGCCCFVHMRQGHTKPNCSSRHLFEIRCLSAPHGLLQLLLAHRVRACSKLAFMCWFIHSYIRSISKQLWNEQMPHISWGSSCCSLQNYTAEASMLS